MNGKAPKKEFVTGGIDLKEVNFKPWSKPRKSLFAEKSISMDYLFQNADKWVY
jgi:hypothetical protein